MTDTSNMPLYVSHKEVHALEISGLGDYGPDGRVITFTDGSSRTIKREVFARYTPAPGDFYVVYRDGYESFSPRQEFLDGYTVRPGFYTTHPSSFTDIKKEIKGG